MKPVIYSSLAHEDIRATIIFYEEEAGAAVARDFVDALEKAAEHLSTWPATGSARFAELLGLPGLRSWGLRPFPYILFYMELGDRIGLWRVLHERRDIPTILQSL